MVVWFSGDAPFGPLRYLYLAYLIAPILKTATLSATKRFYSTKQGVEIRFILHFVFPSTLSS